MEGAEGKRGSVDLLREYAHCVAQALEGLPWADVGRAVEVLHDARLGRAMVFTCGNGGSAATAAHFANDLSKGTDAPGMPRLRAISLVDNVPLLTAWANDAAYADAFAQQLRNLVRPEDVVVCFSGSGNSPNVLNAVRLAREVGATTIGFTGGRGGKLAEMVDLAVVVPNPCMEQIEDVHMLLEHAIISALRDRARSALVPSLLLANGRGAWPRSRGGGSGREKTGAVFLDRDGVLNADRPDYVKSWEEFCLLPGTLAALRELAKSGLPVVVITNQAAINRGLVSFEVAESINLRMMAQLNASGARVDAVGWCPHRPEEGCGCRKPEAGLLTYAAEALDLDLGRSYLVGDAESDIAAGMAVGCKALFVLTGRGPGQRAQVEAHWGGHCKVLADLAEAVRWILDDLGGGHVCG